MISNQHLENNLYKFAWRGIWIQSLVRKIIGENFAALMHDILKQISFDEKKFCAFKLNVLFLFIDLEKEE